MGGFRYSETTVRYLPLLGLILVLPLAPAASFECTFVNSKGKPIRNVEARLIPRGAEEDAAKKTVYQTTGRNGQILIRGLAERPYTLEAQMKGYVSLRAGVEVAGTVQVERTLLKEKEFDQMEEQARSAINASEFRTARDLLLRMTEWYPDAPSLHENLAHAYAGLAYRKSAMKHAELAVALDPARAGLKTEVERVLLHNAGLMALHEKDSKTAQKKFAALTKIDPESAPAWHGLALAHGQQGQLKKAIELIDRALDLDPGNAEMLRLKTILKMNAGIE